MSGTRMVGKLRRWQATISISASGPEYDPIFEEAGRKFVPRAAADLRYTTSDSNYLAEHFKRQDYDSCEFEKHYRLVNPTARELKATIDKVDKWFGKHRHKPVWDGGGIVLIYAGHGDESAGAMVLKNDELYGPEVFIEHILKVAKKNTNDERLRVSMIMDSCHSGEFGLRSLNLMFNQYLDYLIPYMLNLSCCSDEVSWEDADLGHGIFTYCFSAHGDIGSITTQAVQPDNSFGPSLSIAKGEKGVSLLTAGAQNPIVYFNGAGFILVGSGDFSIRKENHEDSDFLSLHEMRAKTIQLRDEYIKKLEGVGDLRVGRMTASESRQHAQKLKRDLSPGGALRIR